MRESETVRILIFDQSPKSREAMCSILRQESYAADTVATAQHALDVISCEQYDVLVTDAPLSSMGRSGWLHNGPPSASEIPVVAIVGSQDRGNEPDPLPDQVKVVLSTPVRKGELLAAVREALCIGPEHSLFSR